MLSAMPLSFATDDESIDPVSLEAGGGVRKTIGNGFKVSCRGKVAWQLHGSKDWPCTEARSHIDNIDLRPGTPGPPPGVCTALLLSPLRVS